MTPCSSLPQAMMCVAMPAHRPWVTFCGTATAQGFAHFCLANTLGIDIVKSVRAPLCRRVPGREPPGRARDMRSTRYVIRILISTRRGTLIPKSQTKYVQTCMAHDGRTLVLDPSTLSIWLSLFLGLFHRKAASKGKNVTLHTRFKPFSCAGDMHTLI